MIYIMKLTKFFLLVMFITLVGCSSHNHTHILADNNNPEYHNYLKYGDDSFIGDYTNPKPTISMSNHFFFGGYGQTKHIDAIQMCKNNGFNKVNLVINEKRWYDGILSVITLGIYTPTSTYIWCE